LYGKPSGTGAGILCAVEKGELSAYEQVKLNICRQAVNDIGIMTATDADSLREQTSQLDKKIAAIKENLDS
jgi:polyhydroxyalkanoate synthesis regulator phasin